MHVVNALPKRDKRITVFLFFVTSLFAFRFDILGLCDPVEVAPQILLNLLLLAQLLEVAAGFGLLPLLGKFTAAQIPTQIPIISIHIVSTYW